MFFKLIADLRFIIYGFIHVVSPRVSSICRSISYGLNTCHQRTDKNGKDQTYRASNTWHGADDVLFLNLGREEKYFLYLVRKSDFYSTYQELKEAKQVTRWQVKDSRHGLQWVIRKLNQKRPRSKQIGPQI